MSKITESTLIPISLILVIVSGVSFFANVSFETSANTKAIALIKTEQDILAKELVETQKDLLHTQKEISIKLTEIQGDLRELKRGK